MTAPDPAVAGGHMTWAEARAEHLVDATCLWQDLDGLHIGPAPYAPPPTSIIWGWTKAGAMLRLRLDGETVYLARCEDGTAHAVLPWAPDDGRIQARRTEPRELEMFLELEQVVVDGIATGVGPITLIRRKGAMDGR